jgi:prophage regulatory protein
MSRSQPAARTSDATHGRPRDQRPRLLSMAEVSRRVLFTRIHVYRLISAGKFPRPIKLGEHRIAFVEQEVDDFIAARIAERDSAGG